MKEPLFTGAATAIITPFQENGSLDLTAYDQLLDRQLNAGISAIVVTGTTGEGSTLTEGEKHTLWKHTADYVRGRTKLIAGVGTNCTEQSVRLAKLAHLCGMDGLLAVTPYYNKCTQDSLVQHYTAITDATPLPVILYNVPSRTGVNLLPETCHRLSAHSNINGIKEASGNISQIAKTISLCGDDLPLWSGNDDQIVPVCALGGIGVISVLSNVLPEAVIRLCNTCTEGDFQKAAELQLQLLPLIEGLFLQVNPIPVKALLSELGLCKNILRLPLAPMDGHSLRGLYSQSVS